MLYFKFRPLKYTCCNSKLADCVCNGKSTQSLEACFSKVLIINTSGKLLLFTFKIKVSIVLQIP